MLLTSTWHNLAIVVAKLHLLLSIATKTMGAEIMNYKGRHSAKLGISVFAYDSVVSVFFRMWDDFVFTCCFVKPINYTYHLNNDRKCLSS